MKTIEIEVTTKTSVVVRPCPFCGEADAIAVSDGRAASAARSRMAMVYCTACPGESFGPTADTPEEAVELWNTRPDAPSS